MNVWLSVGLIVFGLLVLMGEPLAKILGLVFEIQDDLKNRNDRGLLRKSSSKHVV